MRNLPIALVVLIGSLPAALLLGQVNRVESFERNFRPHVAQEKIGLLSTGQSIRIPQSRLFHIDGLAYRAAIAGESLKSSPDWTPLRPMPVSFARLEQVARQELAKLVNDNTSWSVTSFQLHSIPEDLGLKWYFVIEMKPFWEPGPSGTQEKHDSFCVYVDLSGKPGLITRQH